jgi:hypothetical protein
MSAVLTYHVRAGQLGAVAAGKVFHLPTHKDPARVLMWEKVQELRSGKLTLWDHCFEPPYQQAGRLPSLTGGIPAQTVIQRVSLVSKRPKEVRSYDWPGEYAQRFDGTDARPGVQHHHLGSAVYIGDRQAGVYVHGWPPCNLKPCIVVLHQWDDLRQAIASEAELSFAIVF